MSRSVLNIGPLLIEETKTHNGSTVYRMYTRSANNSYAKIPDLKRIMRALENELAIKGVRKSRTQVLRDFYVRHPEKRPNKNAQHRKWWNKNKDEINAKRREARKKK